MIFDPGKNGTRVIYVAKHVKIGLMMASRIDSEYVHL